MIRTVTVLSLVLASVSLSFAQETISTQSDKSIKIRVGKDIFTTRANPKALALPSDSAAFQFAIYGDRTGGNPSGLKFLRQAVDDTNLIDPDLVMTVGDLIQGYNRPDEWMPQMKEFCGIMNELEMEWFPVAGNHDIYWDFKDPDRPREHHEGNYEREFGPLWYSFRHKETGFIVLYSDEGDLETGEKGFNAGRMQNMSEEQLGFLEKALEKLADCKHVFCFLHHPRWLGGGYEGSNWPEVHQRMVAAGNVGAVFAGHIHHMTFHGPVDGIEYYSLGTTGGHLSMDAPELGYLHHFNLVTVRPDGFSVSAIPVGAVIDPKSFDKEFLDDVNRVRNTRPTRHGNKLTVALDGSVDQEYEIAFKNPGKHPVELTMSPQAPKGWRAVPDHQHKVIGPGKTESTKFHFVRVADQSGEPADNHSSWANRDVPNIKVSLDYLHPKTRVRLPGFSVPVEMQLAEVPDELFSETNSSLHLRGKLSGSIRRVRENVTTDSGRILSSEFELPQGPFTLEAWVFAEAINESRGIVAKTQSSEFALFLHDGFPQFDVHLDGSYVSPKSDKKIALNKWTHVAGVFDGEACHLFVDGIKVKSLPGSGTRKLNSLPLFIGADPDGYGNPTREFAGQIDEVRLSVGALYSKDFEPSTRHSANESTKILLNFDRQVGPFALDASQSRVSTMLLGNAVVRPATNQSPASSTK